MRVRENEGRARPSRATSWRVERGIRRCSLDIEEHPEGPNEGRAMGNPQWRRSAIRLPCELRGALRALHHNWITRSVLRPARAQLKQSNLPLRRHSTQYAAAIPLAITSLTSNMSGRARSIALIGGGGVAGSARLRLPARTGSLRDRTAT